MLYQLASKALFTMPTEVSHDLSLSAIAKAARLGLPLGPRPREGAEIELMGLKFKNLVGLAAGLDKNGDCIDGMANLGFGFIEIGTVTPRPQPGNPKPRLFRAQKQQALVNRMGFNNKGVDHLVDRVQNCSYEGVLGINIGKNKDTPLENAVEDYLICLRKVFQHASYVTVNISSPNTEDLRSLQHGNALDDLLKNLKDEQQLLSEKYKKKVPLVVKIAPDLNDEELDAMAETLLRNEIEGVVSSNTTIDKSSLAGTSLADEAGGLSGKPLLEPSNRILQKLSIKLDGRIPIMGVGGISSAQDAISKLDNGANLVQIYSGFIYQGPKLIADIVDAYLESHYSAS